MPDPVAFELRAGLAEAQAFADAGDPASNARQHPA